MNDQKNQSPISTLKQLGSALVVFTLGIIMVLPWRLLLESLKKDNPQLSLSPLVQYVPVFLSLVVWGVVKARRNSESE